MQDLQLYPREYTVVDLETSGVNHFRDSIIEIGAIKYVDCKEKSRFSVLVRIEKKLAKKIVDLTGITDEILESEGIDLENALRLFSEFLGDDVVIGHNISSFDKYFLDDAYNKVFGMTFNNLCIDTLTLARKLYPDMEHHRLEDLAGLFGVDYSNAHRAVEDCDINNAVYICMAFGEEQETDSLEELVDIDETDLVGWKKNINDLLITLETEHILPKKSLCLKGNVGKGDPKAITSYSICIVEYDVIQMSNRNPGITNVLNIKENTKKTAPTQLRIEPKSPKLIEDRFLPEGSEVHNPDKTKPYLFIDQNSDGLATYIRSCVGFELENYVSKSQPFACCSRYKECSEKKKCTHPNSLFSKACVYQTNLVKGLVFF